MALLLTLSALPKMNVFELVKQGKLSAASPQSATLALAQFVGLFWVSLTKLHDAEIPSARGLSHWYHALVGASWCRCNTVSDHNNYVVDL